MKNLYIIANWKSNLTSSEASSWFQRLKIKNLTLANKEIIVCPSLTALPILKSLIINHKSSIKLGTQDISPFGEGAYTGEVNGKQIKEFADFVIIGHSERRKNFLESDEIVDKKIEITIQYGVTPILCISNISQIQNSKVKYQNYNVKLRGNNVALRNSKLKSNETKVIVAYEPLFAIGSGNPDTPENAESMAKQIKEIVNVPVLYGGSVTLKNVKEFTQMPTIDGVLVGGASLDAQEFYEIIQNA